MYVYVYTYYVYIYIYICMCIYIYIHIWGFYVGTRTYEMLVYTRVFGNLGRKREGPMTQI